MDTFAPALVVVDVQNGFVTQESAHVVPTICDLVDRWMSANLDVVFTRYINYSGSPFERIMGWSKLRDAPETDIIDELQPYVPRAVATIDKNVYSLFTADGERLVKSAGWTDLYVCGIDTEVCVLKTAVDAFERDITPWIVTDASASHAGPKLHDAGLLVASKMIGRRQLLSVSTVIEIAANRTASTGRSR